MKVKNDHRSKFSNLSNWKEEAWKNQGFIGIRTRDLRVTGALLYQPSYEATHWERGRFIEFISPVRSEMMWRIHEIIHFWTAVVDESEDGVENRDKVYSDPFFKVMAKTKFKSVFQSDAKTKNEIHFRFSKW